MKINEIITEAVGGNYLYHSVESAETAKAILSSGKFIANTDGKQPASDAQTTLPSVSFSRNLQYAMDGTNVGRDYKLVFVIDRSRLETNYKTLGTSQSQNTTGLAHGGNTEWLRKSKQFMPKLDTNKNGKIDSDELTAPPPAMGMAAKNISKHLHAPKSGGEFEEIVPTRSGGIPLQGLLIGFYIVPGKGLETDPELANHPLRLDMPRPNTFVKHSGRT